MMNKEDLLKRIKMLDSTIVKNMSPDVIAKLTDKFKEPLVREILYTTESNIEQRQLINAIIKAYKKWMEDNEPLWKTFNQGIPDYMSTLQMDIELDMVITREGSVPLPKIKVAVNPVLDYSNILKTITETKTNATSQKGNDSKDTDTETAKARIKELEAEVERLKAENEQLSEASRNQDTNKRLEDKIDSLVNVIEDILVEGLKPAFYNTEEDVRRFLKEIDGLNAEEIAKVAGQYLKDRKIVPSKCKRDIWKFLYAAQIYDKVEQNWSAAMRKYV